MKNKKEWSDSKYPVPHLEKLKSVLNSNKDSEKAREEKKRLKVFTQVCNMNASKKKIDEKTKLQTKEQSKERRTEGSAKLREDSGKKSLSKERRNLKLFPPAEARSPNLGNKTSKVAQNLVSQSFDNLNMAQMPYQDSRRQSYFPPNYALNQSFSPSDMSIPQYYSPNHDWPTENSMHANYGFNMNPGHYTHSSNNFYPDMRQHQNYTSFQPPKSHGTRTFVPAIRQNRGNSDFANTQSHDKSKAMNPNVNLNWNFDCK